MLALPDIRLAVASDARHIAEMSRDYIEHGLGWSWRPARVLRSMREPSTNVVVVQKMETISGFGIMQYEEDTAHLALLAVHPVARHQKLGALLVSWLERSARFAGVRHIRLEARADNQSAIAFYERLHYSRAGKIAGYYDGVLDAVQLEKKLA